MKSLKYLTLALLPLGQATAALYTFDEFSAGFPLAGTATEAGVPGWTQSQANPSDTQPLAWISGWDFPSPNPGNLGLAIGGFYDIPSTSSFAATVSTASTHFLVGSLVSFDMTLVDSTNDFPDRDAFGFSIADGNGEVARFDFIPVAQSPTPESLPLAQWNVSYTVRGNDPVATTIPLIEGNAYNMSVEFDSVGLSFTFGNELGSANFLSTPVGYDVENDTLGEVSLLWSKMPATADFGDNFMLVDNFSIAPGAVIPEPTSVTLCLASLGLLMRRKRRQS